MIQWLDPSGTEVAMTTTEQMLDLPFNPVSDSLHNSVYTCRATRSVADGGPGEQTVTLTVTGECVWFHDVSGYYSSNSMCECTPTITYTFPTLYSPR